MADNQKTGEGQSEEKKKYFDYEGNPAVLEPQYRPYMYVGGKLVTIFDTFRFSHEADPISKAEFDKMMAAQGATEE